MPFQVVVQPRAQADIAGTVLWLARSNPRTAERWREGLLQIIGKLETDATR